MALLGCCKMAKDFITLQQTSSISTKVNKGVEHGAVAVFHCPTVQKVWTGWLQAAFAQTQTTNALLNLVLHGIQHNRFLAPVTQYAQNLVDFAFRTQPVQKSASLMIYDVLVMEPRVV